MGFIGSFGDLVFSVSANRVLTYSEITMKSSGRWAEHEPIGSPPIGEFLGSGQDETTLKIMFSPILGVDPESSYSMLREMTRTGQHFPLIIAGVPLSNADWRIESVENTATMFAKDGSGLWVECNITVKEYN